MALVKLTEDLKNEILNEKTENLRIAILVAMVTTEEWLAVDTAEFLLNTYQDRLEEIHEG